MYWVFYRIVTDTLRPTENKAKCLLDAVETPLSLLWNWNYLESSRMYYYWQVFKPQTLSCPKIEVLDVMHLSPPWGTSEICNGLVCVSSLDLLLVWLGWQADTQTLCKYQETQITVQTNNRETRDVADPLTVVSPGQLTNLPLSTFDHYNAISAFDE